MADTTDRSAKGKAILDQLHAKVGVPILDSLRDVAPDFKQLINDFAFGEVYARPGLDLKSRQLATVAALVALNNAPVQLKAHLHGALNVGWTPEELVEAITQMLLYAGCPAAMNGLFVLKEVLAEREQL